MDEGDAGNWHLNPTPQMNWHSCSSHYLGSRTYSYSCSSQKWKHQRRKERVDFDFDSYHRGKLGG